MSNGAFLLRPAQASWIELEPSGRRPAARCLHAAALLCGDGSEGDGAAGSPGGLLRVCFFGGWSVQPQSYKTYLSERHRSSVRERPALSSVTTVYLNDLHLLTLDPTREGACHWAQLKPAGPPPSPRAETVAVPTADGGVLFFGGRAGEGDEESQTHPVDASEPAGLQVFVLRPGAISAAIARAASEGDRRQPMDGDEEDEDED